MAGEADWPQARAGARGIYTQNCFQSWIRSSFYFPPEGSGTPTESDVRSERPDCQSSRSSTCRNQAIHTPSALASDIIPVSPDGKQGFTVRAIDSNRSMLWVGKNVTWSWTLRKLDVRHTRLVTRVHLHYAWVSPSIFSDLLFDPGDFVMMRRMLLGIKQRAEDAGKRIGAVCATADAMLC